MSVTEDPCLEAFIQTPWESLSTTYPPHVPDVISLTREEGLCELGSGEEPPDKFTSEFPAKKPLGSILPPAL